MKRCILLSIAILPIIFGCSKDDDASNQNELEGTWVSSAVEVTGCEDESDNYTTTCDSPCLFLRIAADSTFEETDASDGDGEIREGTIVVSGSDLILCDPDGESNCVRKSFSQDGDSMSLSSTDEDGCLRVIAYTRP
ncbi:MAG: hypothetical protein JXQ96_00495 [Cyclobacteriaceae bacterium]